MSMSDNLPRYTVGALGSVGLSNTGSWVKYEDIACLLDPRSEPCAKCGELEHQVMMAKQETGDAWHMAELRRAERDEWKAKCADLRARLTDAETQRQGGNCGAPFDLPESPSKGEGEIRCDKCGTVDCDFIGATNCAYGFHCVEWTAPEPATATFAETPSAGAARTGIGDGKWPISAPGGKGWCVTCKHYGQGDGCAKDHEDDFYRVDVIGRCIFYAHKPAPDAPEGGALGRLEGLARPANKRGFADVSDWRALIRYLSADLTMRQGLEKRLTAVETVLDDCALASEQDVLRQRIEVLEEEAGIEPKASGEGLTGLEAGDVYCKDCVNTVCADRDIPEFSQPGECCGFTPRPKSSASKGASGDEDSAGDPEPPRQENGAQGAKQSIEVSAGLVHGSAKFSGLREKVEKDEHLFGTCGKCLSGLTRYIRIGPDGHWEKKGCCCGEHRDEWKPAGAASGLHSQEESQGTPLFGGNGEADTD